MKPSVLTSTSHSSRFTWIAAAMAILAGTSAIAQSGTSSSGRTQSTSSSAIPSDRPGTADTTATGSGYHSGRASADADAATEINAQTAQRTGDGRLTGRAMTGDKLSWGDRRFVTKAADAGQAELQVAQLATQRASNPEVRNFAQELIEAHSKVNSELMNIASEKNVKIEADDDKDRFYKRLSKKAGAEFDQEFVEHMIDGHERDIKMFEKAAQDAKDADIRSFAAKHVDHLRGHLQTAEGLRQSVLPTGRTDDLSGRRTQGGTTRAEASASNSSSTDAAASRDATNPSNRPETTDTPDTADTTTTPKTDGQP